MAARCLWLGGAQRPPSGISRVRGAQAGAAREFGSWALVLAEGLEPELVSHHPIPSQGLTWGFSGSGWAWTHAPLRPSAPPLPMLKTHPRRHGERTGSCAGGGQGVRRDIFHSTQKKNQPFKTAADAPQRKKPCFFILISSTSAPPQPWNESVGAQPGCVGWQSRRRPPGSSHSSVAPM